MGSLHRFPMTTACMVSKSKHRKHIVSSNIALTVLVALSLAQPFCSSSRVNYISTVRWPLNTITCSFTNKTQQTEATALQLPSRKEETSQQLTMISTKRIAQLAKKWQRMAALGRKQLTWRAAAMEADECCTSVASKGHCVVYTTDGVRFEVPLACLSTAVFAELLRMSQEEFGFGGDDGKITLSCDAAVMDYAMCLLRKGASAEVEKAFLSTMAMSCHYANHVVPYVAVCC
ncbi:auxin-responsive protein SAUR36-like [Setaria italica]|uniref:auxin-responsive protein SAUR36-like n=1 Tax=Setaria italica TaxID=4555 RepID=UPI0006480243|nr:auxin-responsive protein SAUR36-like [Setaria italica]